MFLLMPAIAKVATVSYCFGLWFFSLQLPPCLWYSFQIFAVVFQLLPFIILIQSKWLEMKSSFDVERYKRHEGHGWTRVICTRGCGIAINYSSLSWLWPGDAILLEKVGKKFFLDFDILSSKIIYTPCRKVEKPSWFYFPFHFAFSFLCLAPLCKRKPDKLQCSF